MLIIRGQNIEGAIDKVFDREKLKFKPDIVPGLEDLSYKATPHVMFISNKDSKQAMIDFILETKFVNMYLDTT